MSVFQQGRDAGGWTGTTVAGQNIIPTLLEHEKQNAETKGRTFVEDAFHIAEICIEAPAGTTFSINDGTKITIPTSGIYHNSTSVLKILIFDQAVSANIAYCW